MLLNSRECGDRQSLVSEKIQSKKNIRNRKDNDDRDTQVGVVDQNVPKSFIRDTYSFGNIDPVMLNTNSSFTNKTATPIKDRNNTDNVFSSSSPKTINPLIISRNNLFNEQSVVEISNSETLELIKIDSKKHINIIIENSNNEESKTKFTKDNSLSEENLINEQLLQIYKASSKNIKLKPKTTSNKPNKNPQYDVECINVNHKNKNFNYAEKEIFELTKFYDTVGNDVINNTNSEIKIDTSKLELTKSVPNINRPVIKFENIKIINDEDINKIVESDQNRNPKSISCNNKINDLKKLRYKKSNEAGKRSNNLEKELIENTAYREIRSHSSNNEFSKVKLKRITQIEENLTKPVEKNAQIFLPKSDWTKFEDENPSKNCCTFSEIDSPTKNSVSRLNGYDQNLPLSSNTTKNTPKLKEGGSQINKTNKEYERSHGQNYSDTKVPNESEIVNLVKDCFVENSQRLHSICERDEIKFINEHVVIGKRKYKSKRANKRIRKTGKTIWTGLKTSWRVLVDGLVALSGPLAYVDFSSGVSKVWAQKRNNY